jgi:hypothetical protein
MMALIKYKHIEHVTQKNKLMDLIMHMVPTVMWWNKITKEFSKLIKTKMPRNGTCVRTSGMELIHISKSFLTTTRVSNTTHYIGN